jgi:carboxyl-terminal processing protease
MTLAPRFIKDGTLPMKLQSLACAVALASGGLFFTHVVNEATAASTMSVLTPSREQSLVARQLATLMDRQHYLNMPLDEATSRRVLDMYIDVLDPEHSLFLQHEIDEFKQKYADQLGRLLKEGDLSPAFDIYQHYLIDMQAYQTYVLAQLDQPQNLNGSEMIEVDREKSPFFATNESRQHYWHQQLVSQLISLTVGKEEEVAKQKALQADPSLANGQDLSSSALGAVETLKKRYQRQSEQLGRVKNDQVLEGILNAALATYDPHSNYFAPVEAMEMNRQTTLALEGIGVSIRPERGNDDYTRIESIVDGGPASKSGQVRAGDRITGVAQDGGPLVDVVGWPSNEIVGLIRGKRGTKVTVRLQASSPANAPSRQILLVRDVIEQDDAGLQHRVVEVKSGDQIKRMGVLDIPSFYLNYRARRSGDKYRSVSEDTEAALRDLNNKHIDGLIVDLRANPGGSLEEVSKMLSMFIKEGPLVQIRDSNGRVSLYEDNDGGQQVYSGPMTVLINLASASASEIFAAAIQDYGRGIILGSTTTGKGTAQIQLDSLAYGQATLTQRKFYRVTGGSTQNKGVIPDIELVNLYDADLGERAAKNALKWDTIKTAAYVRDQDFGAILPTLQQQSLQRQVSSPQFVFLNEVRNIGLANKNRKQLSLNLGQRRQELQQIEGVTLQAENKRRVATGLAPYANWETYQAALDAQAEIRAKLKLSERPVLPEEEAYVLEAAQVLLDAEKLRKTAASTSTP